MCITFYFVSMLLYDLSFQFIELFASTRTTNSSVLVPWCWGLVEWWSWLTPLCYPARRYDTVFYTAILPHAVIKESTLSYSRESETLKVKHSFALWVKVNLFIK